MPLYFESHWVIRYDEMGVFFDLFDIADKCNVQLCAPNIELPSGHRTKWIIAQTESEDTFKIFVGSAGETLTLDGWIQIDKPDFFVRTLNPRTELESNIQAIWRESIISSARYNQELTRSAED